MGVAESSRFPACDLSVTRNRTNETVIPGSPRFRKMQDFNHGTEPDDGSQNMPLLFSSFRLRFRSPGASKLCANFPFRSSSRVVLQQAVPLRTYQNHGTVRRAPRVPHPRIATYSTEGGVQDYKLG